MQQVSRWNYYNTRNSEVKMDYIKEYSNVEFEILTEGYFGYSTTYTGWIWAEGQDPVSAIMYIWNTGDMVYRIDN